VSSFLKKEDFAGSDKIIKFGWLKKILCPKNQDISMQGGNCWT